MVPWYPTTARPEAIGLGFSALPEVIILDFDFPSYTAQASTLPMQYVGCWGLGFRV